jgi:hypothetical protein
MSEPDKQRIPGYQSEPFPKRAPVERSALYQAKTGDHIMNLHELVAKAEQQLQENEPLRQSLYHLGITDNTIKTFKIGHYEGITPPIKHKDTGVHVYHESTTPPNKLSDIIGLCKYKGITIPLTEHSDIIGVYIYKIENNTIKPHMLIGDNSIIWNSYSIRRSNLKPVVITNSVIHAVMVYERVGDIVTTVAIEWADPDIHPEYLDCIGKILLSPVIVMVPICEDDMWYLQEWEKTFRHYSSELKLTWVMRRDCLSYEESINIDLARSAVNGICGQIESKIEEALRRTEDE